MGPCDGVQVADMLLELCVTELEDVATDSQSGRLSSQPVVVESSHPYTDDTSTSGTVKIPGIKRKRSTFQLEIEACKRQGLFRIIVDLVISILVLQVLRV